MCTEVTGLRVPAVPCLSAIFMRGMLSAQSFSPHFRDLIGAGLISARFREAFGRLPAISLERTRETGTGGAGGGKPQEK